MGGERGRGARQDRRNVQAFIFSVGVPVIQPGGLMNVRHFGRCGQPSIFVNIPAEVLKGEKPVELAPTIHEDEGLPQKSNVLLSNGGL